MKIIGIKKYKIACKIA